MGNICAKTNEIEPSRNRDKRPNKINTHFSTLKITQLISKLNVSIKSNNFLLSQHKIHRLQSPSNTVSCISFRI